jgi:hypothetical protein
MILMSLSVLGCGKNRAGTRPFVYLDAGVIFDGNPIPFFREAGCGPGVSGGSGGPCGPSGSSGVRMDSQVPPADTMPVDQMQPDQCVPPSTWDCPVTMSFDKRGSEATGGVHGDFDGPSPTPWVTKNMTLKGNTWSVDLQLPNNSKLTYKFVVDEGLPSAQWFEDPNNPNKVSDGLGGFNSVLDVSCKDPCARAIP